MSKPRPQGWIYGIFLKQRRQCCDALSPVLEGIIYVFFGYFLCKLKYYKLIPDSSAAKPRVLEKFRTLITQTSKSIITIRLQ